MQWLGRLGVSGLLDCDIFGSFRFECLDISLEKLAHILQDQKFCEIEKQGVDTD